MHSLVKLENGIFHQNSTDCIHSRVSLAINVEKSEDSDPLVIEEAYAKASTDLSTVIEKKGIDLSLLSKQPLYKIRNR